MLQNHTWLVCGPRWMAGVRFAILSILGLLFSAQSTMAIVIDFDAVPLHHSYPLELLSNIQSPSGQIAQTYPQSAPYSLFMTGTDNTNAYSYAYFRVASGLGITITSDTVVQYSVRPVWGTGRYVAVDIITADGLTMRDSSTVDQNGIGCHPVSQGDYGGLTTGVYTRVECRIGAALAGKVIDKVLVAYDEPYTSNGYYAAVVDDIRIDSSRFVWIAGSKLDHTGLAPFTAAKSEIAPLGGGSTCGASENSQLGRSCAPSVSEYHARAKVKRGSVQISTRVPGDKDVLVSVCTADGSEGSGVVPGGLYNCSSTDPHPAESYCRPKQGKSTAKLKLALPESTPLTTIDINWKYVDENPVATECDAAGLPKYAIAAQQPSGSAGDLDDNGVINQQDAIAAANCSGLEAQGRILCGRGDLDCNGAVGSTDMTRILQIAELDYRQLACDFCGLYTYDLDPPDVAPVTTVATTVLDYAYSADQAVSRIQGHEVRPTLAFVPIYHHDYACTITKNTRVLTRSRDLTEQQIRDYAALSAPAFVQNRMEIAGVYLSDEPERDPSDNNCEYDHDNNPNTALMPADTNNGLTSQQLSWAIEAWNEEVPGLPTMVYYSNDGNDANSPAGLTYRATGFYVQDDDDDMRDKLQEVIAHTHVDTQIIVVPRLFRGKSSGGLGIVSDASLRARLETLWAVTEEDELRHRVDGTIGYIWRVDEPGGDGLTIRDLPLVRQAFQDRCAVR